MATVHIVVAACELVVGDLAGAGSAGRLACSLGVLSGRAWSSGHTIERLRSRMRQSVLEMRLSAG